MTKPLVIGHRGASGDQPENTLAAFEEAIAQGADMIETDLHLSQDGFVVIHHDADLERLGVHGEIREWTLEALHDLDAAPGYPFEARIPTLLDLLDGFGERVAFNLELKVGESAAYPGLEDLVVTELERRGLVPKMLLSCFQDPVLERLRERSAEARIAVLVSPREPEAILARAARVGAEAINPHCLLVTEDLVDRAHGAGLSVYPYTANEEDEMNRLLDCGVDGIISNFPSRLKSIVERRKSA